MSAVSSKEKQLPYSSYQEFRGDIQQRVVQRLIQKTLDNPIADVHAFVQKYIKKNQSIKKILDKKEYKRLKTTNQDELPQKLEQLFKKHQKLFTHKHTARKLFLATLTPKEEKKIISSVREFRKLLRKVDDHLSGEHIYELFDQSWPVRLIKPEAIFRTCIYYLDPDEDTQLFKFNGKERPFPSIAQDPDDQTKYRQFLEWMISEMDPLIPGAEKKKPIEKQLDYLFEQQDFKFLKEKFKRSLEKEKFNRKTLETSVQKFHPELRPQSIADSIDWKDKFLSQEEIVEQATESTSKRIALLDCKKWIPSFGALQFFSFNAFAGAVFALKTIFKQTRHEFNKGSTRYDFHFDDQTFQVTHKLNYAFFHGNEKDPIATVDVCWTLSSRYMRDPKPIGILRFENLTWTSPDIEKIKHFLSNFGTNGHMRSPSLKRRKVRQTKSKGNLLNPDQINIHKKLT